MKDRTDFPESSIDTVMVQRPAAVEDFTKRADDWYRRKLALEREGMQLATEMERFRLYEHDGQDSTGRWFANHFGLGVGRTSEFVNVALALQKLPKSDEAYGQGRISYDHLRAITQVANDENEADLLAAVEGTSVKDTFKVVDRIIEVSAEDSRNARSNRYLSMRWDHDSRLLWISGALPEEEGALFETAIDTLAKRMPKKSVDGDYTPIESRRADALSLMADSTLAQHPSKPRVVVHVDADTLLKGEGAAEVEGGSTISAETAKRLCCDASLQKVINQDGVPIGVGRAMRTVPHWILTFLKLRDATCRFPGCDRRNMLDAHHILHWINGGPTNYDNLVLLCKTHHYMVHEGGYTVSGEPPKTWIERPGKTPIKVGPPIFVNKRSEAPAPMKC
ncbi:MAG TPA: DUF222 domain-containing protein [Actinomycetota bacterium]|nr:DUF222 domain-containing protein [Actinomycetota bacterium]